MPNELSRTQRNQELYKNLEEKNEQSLNQWNKLSKELEADLLKINQELFTTIYKQINQDLEKPNLYNINSLSYDEKINAIEKKLKAIYLKLDEIEDKKLKSSNENSFLNLQSQESFSIDHELKKLLLNLDSLESIAQQQQSFQNLFENVRKIEDYRVLFRKYVEQWAIKEDLGKTKKTFAEKQEIYKMMEEDLINQNKKKVSSLKQKLNDYKPKYIWFLIVLGLCIIGAVLAIVIPSVI